MSKKTIPLRVYEDIADVMSKAYQASHNVLDENKKLGIPTPFSLRGRIYYLMPDGKIILKRNGRKG